MRTILHSDLNNFYATVECQRNSSIKNLPVAVVGDKEARHGVVLAKNQIAKQYGVATGDVIWEAKLKCGNLIVINANFPLYIAMSREVRKIYERYTDRIEAFGIDECWLDVTESFKLFGDGEQIANKIRYEIKNELGLTVSVGVSYNKIFAKLASEIKKPDAVTLISKDNYREVAWKLPVEDLLYVGRSTKKKLNSYGIRSIGDLANADIKFLKQKLGKWGVYLSIFAKGNDASPVMKLNESDIVKSIGNSLTHYKDMINYGEIESLIYLLSDSVASRLRDSGLGQAKHCSIHYRESTLNTYSMRFRFQYPTSLAYDIAAQSIANFKQNCNLTLPIRSIGISVGGFTNGVEQLSMVMNREWYDRQEKLEITLEDIKKKHGNMSVKRAVVAKDKKLAELDIKGQHTIHPVSYFKPKKGDYE